MRTLCVWRWCDLQTSFAVLEKKKALSAAEKAQARRLIQSRAFLRCFSLSIFFGSSFPSFHLFPSFLVLILSSFHWAVCLLCLLYLRACQHTACPACLPACPACLPACSVYLPIVLSCSLTNISCSTTCCWPRPHAIAAAERTVPTIQSEGTESMMARTAEIMGGESSSDHPIIYINHILIIYINHIGPQK